MNKNSKNNIYNPTNTGYATLEEFLLNEFILKSDTSFCVFGTYDFSDLPSTGWGYTIIYFNIGEAIFVLAYKHLSNNMIYIRSLDLNANWAGDWQQLSFV